ncbi:3-dehydroquinate dehydratase [Flavobacteriaceae bacterium]|nr:3-dehydroquinate dehydratase [Flavobacteriaceae bacterium]
MKKIIIINGPNLNLLEKRDSSIYGGDDLKTIEKSCQNAVHSKADLEFFQSNSEGEIIEKIQQSILQKIDAIIINAAAYTHTSIAIRDALEMFYGQKIELHISNIFKREDFRHHSVISEVVDGVISGLGSYGYVAAINAVLNKS